MTAKPSTPLRGEAAWRAQKQEIERSNDAASAAAQRRRADKEATVVAEEAQRDRREMQALRGPLHR